VTHDKSRANPVQRIHDEPYWNAIAAHWYQKRPQRLWRLHSDAVNARLIEAWLPVSDRGRLLKTDAFDEAVSGGIAASLGARCRQFVAADIATAVLRAAKGRVGEGGVVAADARSLPFATGSFDTVVSLSTLDHFRTEAELLASLSELRRISSPGAVLVLTLDNPKNPIIGLRGALPLSWLQRLGLVPYFVGANLGPARLREAIAEAGFEVEQETALVHVPRSLAIALGYLVERWGGPRLSAWWLRRLMSFERLGGYSTRFWTGHFVAIRARVP
jgi:SAM-dependent methyltransferase